jgi:hypothetical protein
MTGGREGFGALADNTSKNTIFRRRLYE